MAKRQPLSASRVADAVGFNYCSSSRAAFYKELHGESEPEEPSEFLMRLFAYGKQMEHVTLAEFGRVTGVEYQPNTTQFRHECGWLGATPDALCPQGAPIEVKSIPPWTNGYYPEEEGAKPAHVVQLVTQMYVTGQQSGYLFYHKASTGQWSLFEARLDDVAQWHATVGAWLEEFYSKGWTRMPPGESNRRKATLLNAFLCRPASPSSRSDGPTRSERDTGPLF